MSTTSIIIIAAGQSTRMNSTTPKVMHLISERPTLAYVLETAVKAAPDKIILVTAPGMEAVRDYANTQANDIIHAIQELPLGTADAVKSALTFLDNEGKTLILYGDAPFLSDESVAKIKKTNKDMLLLGFHSKNPNKYGRLITYDDDLLEIVEFNDANDEQRLLTHCNSGIIYLKNKLLHKFIPLIKNKNVKGEYYLTDIIKIANYHRASCSIMNVDEHEVVGINTREDLSAAENIMQKRTKSRLMNQGVTIINPESSYIAHDFQAGGDVTIYPNVFIGAKVKIGDNVNIKSFSYIEGVEIEDDVDVGPFARIRPTSYIAKNSRIGNFVEIKNSKIDYSTKISHLSYIGDSQIGHETNIGAGAITCNYDGIKTKSKTIIGNNVSVGSNVALIAPVTLADGSYIAAGSVITKDVEEDDLAIARSKQVNLAKKAKSLRKEVDK